ncbi:UNVERIFIED_ORG: hypothetical protein ABID33_000536 [Xanthobacter viscosus]|uniref:Uncharacterized protein n=1 Tax=Xanthobacter autotrophicus TaxID=280 RepID=A0A6C1KH38_XANAU|nr:hypothetical protein [Xanthobacter autotrophicus]TLX43599.1 hypothetical protein FBQ73_05635 [Xanthobacter autotrophicus]
MANFFDQFDEPAAPQRNFFDQFDPPPSPLPAAGANGSGVVQPAFDPGIGVQGAARGVGMFLGQLPDIANMGANVLLSGADTVSQKLGGPEIGFRFKMPSETIPAYAGQLASSAGIKVRDPKDMSPVERAVYNANTYGTLGVLSGGALAPVAAARAAGGAARLPKLGDALLESYAAAPGRAVFGEGIAGAGAGAGKSVSEELVPDSVRQSGTAGAVGGALSDVFSMLLGGTVGGVAANVATGLPQAVATARGFGRAPEIPIDAATGQWARNRDADQVARYVQGHAVDPQGAAESIGKGANEFRRMGAPTPTAGVLSQDPGLAAVEAAERNRNPAAFAQKDAALRDAALNELGKNLPPDIDPRLATDFMRREIDTRLNAATGDVNAAEARLADAERAQRATADIVAPFAGGRSDASATLDRSIVAGSLEPMDTARRAAFNAVPRDAEVPGRPFVDTATTVRRSAEHLPENARREVLPEQWLQDFESLLQRDADGRIVGVRDVSFGTINDLRPILGAAIARARNEGAPPPFIDNLERLRSEINRATMQQPEARAAMDHFENVYAPVWGRQAGEAYQFRQDLNVDRLHRTAAPPTATANRFLTTGPGAQEKAEALARVVRSIDDPANRASAEGAVRAYILDDLTRTIGRDGRIQDTRLARWLNGPSGWGDALSQFPGVRGEVERLLTDVRSGNITRNRLAADVARANANLQRTRADVDSSALALTLGKEPTKAAQAVLNSGDPERSMREVMQTVSRDPTAKLAWERAVTEHLIKKVTTANPGAVSEGVFAPEFRRLAGTFREYERALAELYAGQPEKMQALRRAQRMLEPLARQAEKAAPGSVDGTNKSLWRWLELGLKATFGMLKGGGVARTLRVAAGTDANADSAAQRLVTRMMFDPELAQHLLTRDAQAVGSPGWNGKLLRLIGLTEGLKEAGNWE